jgi:hypothetical protein
MKKMHLCIAVALLCAATAVVAQGFSPQPPQLSIVPDAGVNQVWLEVTLPDGTLGRHLVRETSATVVPGASGFDPSGAAAFANWSEAGERFTVWSRDAGASWSDARPIAMDLRLHAGSPRPGEAMPAAAPGLALPQGGQVFLVQFKTQSLPEWRSALTGLGAEVLGFFPHNAHMVRMAPALGAQVAALDFVERVEPYHGSYRLEPELQQWLGGASGPEEIRVNAVVFEWGADAKNRLAAAATAAGARVAELWPNGQRFELWVNRDQLRTLSTHDDAMWFDRWTPRETDMDLVRQDSGADWLEANTGPPGWCGQGVRGEVMDNGIQSSHQDFDGPPPVLLHNAADQQSHGTNTYGIVFGNGARDGDGDATATGHMPCAEQGIFADYGPVVDRFAHTQELKNAPYFASLQTNSWGNARTTAYNSISQEMDDIIFRLDIAILQSQSNAGNQQSRPQAWAKNIIAVGGIRHFNTLSEADDAWNSGASIGPAADGRIKPDLNYWYDNIRTTTTGNGYTSTFGGTSAATPEAAGVVGLMVQMWSENVWNTNPTGGTVFERQPHAATIKALAINNAKQYTFTGTSSDLTRTHQGWGRPNVQIAQERAADSFIVDEEDALTIGQSKSYTVNVTAGEPELKVTMIYKDPPGTTSSTLHRINNVDLKVLSPGGAEVYHGNVGLDAGNYSIAGGGPNNVDTVENVFVQNPAGGAWTVEVTAAEVNLDGNLDTPGDDVVYALVVTGGSSNPAVCGDGVRAGNEQCDGADLGGNDCASAGGCTGGTLGCNVDCTFNFDACTGCPSCDDDGVCEPFEDCNNCPNDCRTGSGAVCGNGVCEIGDGEDCLSCPSDCNGRTGGKPRNRYCCGLDVDCTDSRCVAGGNDCATSTPASCCGDGSCTGDEDGLNCEIDCGPPGTCGDGTCNSDENCSNCLIDCPPDANEFGKCTDGVDNDCDGVTDCDDGDCPPALEPACACAPRNSPCSANVECCSNKCKGNGTCG